LPALKAKTGNKLGGLLMTKCPDCIGKEDCSLYDENYSCMAGTEKEKSGLDGVLEDVMFDERVKKGDKNDGLSMVPILP
jgi:hypothetical protein